MVICASGCGAGRKALAIEETGKREEVFFPINEMAQHWCLAHFDIVSGLVTFYDSGDTYDYESRDFYVRVRECLKERLPGILGATKVFEKKGIDPTDYSIRFKLADHVPKQGECKRTINFIVGEVQNATSHLEHLNCMIEMLEALDAMKISGSRKSVWRYWRKRSTLIKEGDLGVFFGLVTIPPSTSSVQDFDYLGYFNISMETTLVVTFCSVIDVKRLCSLGEGLTIVEDDGDMEKLYAIAEKKLDASAMSPRELVDWAEQEAGSPYLRTPPIKPRRKGIEFPCLVPLDGPIRCLEGPTTWCDLVHECVVENGDSLPIIDKECFSNNVVLDDVVPSNRKSMPLLLMQNGRNKFHRSPNKDQCQLDPPNTEDKDLGSVSAGSSNTADKDLEKSY
ncbi:phospholipase-like protein [Tanacetum coccineum]